MSRTALRKMPRVSLLACALATASLPVLAQNVGSSTRFTPSGSLTRKLRPRIALDWSKTGTSNACAGITARVLRRATWIARQVGSGRAGGIGTGGRDACTLNPLI